MSTVQALGTEDVNYSVVSPNPLVLSTSFAGAYLPDLIPVNTASGVKIITLPLIGTGFAPIGKRVTIRKNGQDVNGVTITPAAGDGISGVLGANTTLLPGGVKGSVTLQATGLNAWEVVESSILAGLVQFGTGTLGGGIGAATITPVVPLGVLCSITVTRRGLVAPGTSVGLRVTTPNIGAGGATFTVQSYDAANAAVAGDTADFSWVAIG